MSMKWRNPAKLAAKQHQKGHSGRNQHVQHQHVNKYAADSGPGSSWDKMQKAKYRAWEREAGETAIASDNNPRRYIQKESLRYVVGGRNGLLEDEVSMVAMQLNPAGNWELINAARQVDKPVHKLVEYCGKKFYVQVSPSGDVTLPGLKWDELGREGGGFGETDDSARIADFNDVTKIQSQRASRVSGYSVLSYGY